MVAPGEVEYSETLSVSWSMTWRLLLADLVLVLLIALFTVAFGSLKSSAIGVVVWGVYLLLHWLVAWPFVIRRTLAPQFMLPLAGIAIPFDPKRIPMRYRACVALGIMADVLSFVPVALGFLLPRYSGLFLALVFFLMRFALVLPTCIYLLARRVGHADYFR